MSNTRGVTSGIGMPSTNGRISILYTVLKFLPARYRAGLYRRVSTTIENPRGADHGRRAAARDGPSDGGPAHPGHDITTSNRLTWACLSTQLHVRRGQVPDAGCAPTAGQIAPSTIAPFIGCCPPTLPRKMVCTKYLGTVGTVSTVAPTGTEPVPGTGTGPAITGNCFFFLPLAG